MNIEQKLGINHEDDDDGDDKDVTLSLYTKRQQQQQQQHQREETAEVEEPLTPFLFQYSARKNYNNNKHYNNKSNNNIRQKMTQFASTLKSVFELPDMSVKDSLKLSFWQKFIKKKRFPFKFVIHLLLVVFVTVQVYMFAGEREEYLYSAGTTIVNRFLPDGFQEIEDSRVGYARFSFYKMDDVVDHVEQTVINYYDFANNSMDYFVYAIAGDESTAESDSYHYNNAHMYQVPSDTIIRSLFKSNHLQSNESTYTMKPIKMINTLYSTLDLDIQMDLSKPLNKKIKTETYHLTPSFPSPFNTSSESPSNLQSYFHRLIQMKLEFDLRTIFIKREYPEVLVWSVSLTYNFEDRGGQVPLLAKYDVSLCSSNRDRISFSQVALSPLTWICVLVIFFSLASIFLVLRAMLYSCRLVRKAKEDAELKHYMKYGVFPDDDPNNTSNVGTNSDLASQTPTTPGDQSEIFIGTSKGVEQSPSLKQRLSLFSAWYLLTLAGNIIGIASSLVVLANVSYVLSDLKASYVLLGLSSIFTWSTMVQYFAHNPKFYILITALRNGFPNVVRFIIGSLPIFIGYGLCGMLLFGSYSQYFQGLENSMVSLFAAANGDVMLDTFDTIYGQNTFLAFLSRIYLVSFVCMFTYSVLKIFILIMEDAYFAVRGDLISSTIQQQFQQNVAETVAHRIEEYEEAKKSHHYNTESDISKIDLEYDSYEDDCSSISSPTNPNKRKMLKKKRKMLKLLDQLASGKLQGNEQSKDTAQLLVQYITLPANNSKRSYSRSVPMSFKPNETSRVSFSLDSPTRPKSSSSKSKQIKLSTPSKSILKDSDNGAPTIVNRDN